MQFSSGLERWADIKNMQEASWVINILTKHRFWIGVFMKK